ncbi:28S ribosomal protein S29, mitochondrial isoform X2 [Clupea harengus]|uniref:Small ribosomal subunit protein mS29 n=1 Tax=Clupea harengus TaxID=7950 RepID=A0A6P8G989_CLUHA|nr:28S ribosomal protein S29, mitochondrial isoform X2 [Clupea harengus]
MFCNARRICPCGRPHVTIRQIMTLHRLSLRLRQAVTQARHLHSSRRGQQLEAVAVEPELPKELSFFRTRESDPACHAEVHMGQYYTLSPVHLRTVFPHGLPSRFQLQMKTFNETCVMVRQPALELISHLKKADYSKPAVRYMFYGANGCGKTISLCHALHYCYTQGWLVLHIPDAHLWVKNCKELLPSTFSPSRFDQPIEASHWLRNFKITNEPLLSKLKTTQRYVWTKRESTEEGRTLAELVEQGVARVRTSSDVVGALLKELRLQAGQPMEGRQEGFRLAVAVDGVNALWGRTSLKKEDKSVVAPEELTLIHNLRKMMKNDWCGGAVISSLSQTGSLFKPKDVYLPQELLGEDGFDDMDPFVPVPVSNYSEKESESCYLYYMDRNWLQHPHSRTEEGKKELLFLSNRNPNVLERLCASL